LQMSKASMGIVRSQALCQGVDQRVRDALEAGRVAGWMTWLDDCASRRWASDSSVFLRHCIS
jgi:hypothetical protein